MVHTHTQLYGLIAFQASGWRWVDGSFLCHAALRSARLRPTVLNAQEWAHCSLYSPAQSWKSGLNKQSRPPERNFPLFFPEFMSDKVESVFQKTQTSDAFRKVTAISYSSLITLNAKFLQTSLDLWHVWNLKSLRCRGKVRGHFRPCCCCKHFNDNQTNAMMCSLLPSALGVIFLLLQQNLRH